jgi:hypothetical protein
MPNKQSNGSDSDGLVVYELPSRAPSRVRLYLKRVEWIWKSAILILAIAAAGWGAARWESAAIRSARESIEQMQQRMIRVESTQDEMRGDLKLIKRRLLGID